MIVVRQISGCLLLGVVSCLPALGADWPQWRGPSRTGVVEESSLRTSWPAEGPPVVWQAEIGTGFSTLVVANGRAFALGNIDDTDILSCLDALTGTLHWRHTEPAPLDPNLFEGGPTASPTVAGDSVLTFSRKGIVLCHDVQTGQVRWRVDVPAVCSVNIPTWGFAGSPVVIGDRVLLNAGSCGVALSLENGAVLWQSDNSDDAGYATPLPVRLDDADGLLLLSGKMLHAVDPVSGRLQWEHRWITRYGVNAADPIVKGDRIWVSSGYGKGTALLELQDGQPKELWRTRELRNQMSPGVLIGEHVYAVDGDAGDDCRLVCLQFATGEVCWSTEGLGSGTLIAADGKLLILSDSGELVVAEASPESFRPLARARILEGKCWTAPVLANGRLYARNADGRTVCIDLRAEPSER